MTISGRRETWIARVDPKRSLLRSGVLSFTLISVPLFGALYLLAVPTGTGAVILGVQLLVSGLSALALLRYLVAFTGVTATEIHDRGFTSPLVRIPLSRVHSIVLVETYRWNAPDSVPQLLMLDADGQRVLRMRGTFWTEGDLRAIAEATGRPLLHFPDPITTQEFFAAYPAASYWFENRPIVSGAAALAAFGLSMVAVLAMMAVTGIRFFAA